MILRNFISLHLLFTCKTHGDLKFDFGHFDRGENCYASFFSHFASFAILKKTITVGWMYFYQSFPLSYPAGGVVDYYVFMGVRTFLMDQRIF